MKKLSSEKAINFINEKGILLVFPIKNKIEPASLWKEFFPKTDMNWSWDDSHDNRVGDMWALMKKLSSSREVVYSKWYQGRATFFSREVFIALLCKYKIEIENSPLNKTAHEILECLESDSPLSTKQLKALTELRGRDNEKFYNQAMKTLFNRLLIVAFGEVDDGAFPSLAVGATKHLYEDLYLESLKMNQKRAEKIINTYFTEESSFKTYLDKVFKF